MNINNLLVASTTGCYYGEEGLVCLNVGITGKNLKCQPVTGDSSRKTVAISMNYFAFRMLDIPATKESVIAGQIKRFLPFRSDKIIWRILPVRDHSFVIAIDEKKWGELTKQIAPNGSSGKVLFISTLEAAIVDYLWTKGPDGILAVPVDSMWLVVVLEDGRISSIDYCENTPDNAIVYETPERIARGAALFKLIPHGMGKDFRGRRPFPGIALRVLVSSFLLCTSILFFFLSVYYKNMHGLEKITEDIKKLQNETKQVEILLERNRKIENTAIFLQRLNHEYVSPYIVLNRISSVLPDHTYLTEFFIDDGRGYITGISSAASDVMEAISGLPFIKSAEFATPVVRDKKGVERFQINFTVKKHGNTATLDSQAPGHILSA